MIKKIFLVIAIIILALQFFRPTKNLSNDQTNAISTKYQIPEKVNQILEVACFDCHSNLTKYPWYFNIQPVAMMMDNHVNDGKKHLNFSTFTSLPIAVQNHKFDEIIETVDEKEMPDGAYTLFGLHKEANLSDSQRQEIISWAKAQMDTLKATYPADSLIMKKRITK